MKIENSVKLIIKGVVQGVGFRPFIYRLARALNLKGFVRNTDEGVLIMLEGEKIEEFIDSLTQSPPPLSDIQSVDIIPLEKKDDFTGFSIEESEDSGGFTLISPDVSICDDCLREMMDKNDRRYLYPFLNCTNCGPRYTITEKIPYDRGNTTMKVFAMCPECEREYNDPTNRRFHAQPNACALCGPHLDFESVDKSLTDASISAIESAVSYLKEGKIVAIKGLGGFHIACNALDDDAVGRLRDAKRKNNKPFALMAPDMATVERHCHVSGEGKRQLESSRRPIVLLNKRTGTGISERVSPGNKYLGFMLPYTPLHYLLFTHPSFVNKGLSCLVMTSGNLSEEPIVIDNDEAKKVLTHCVDGFLFHNRDIFMRADDPVIFLLSNDQEFEAKPFFLRRARGYVPEAINLHSDGPEVLGVGADLKNTFTLTKGKYAIPSQHIGDMENYETIRFYEETLENLKSVNRINPVAAGYDMHPGYLSSRWARELKDIHLVPVQHHHAHIGSVLAGYGRNEKVIGVIFDGTGYGTDGTLWGSEFLIGDALEFKRCAHFQYVPLIGGESAVKHPWKIAVSFIKETVEKDTFTYLDKLGFIERYGEKKINNVLALSEKREFCPLSAGAGRLFDAVAALIGVCDSNTFEGEAPIKLEACVVDGITEDYPVDIIFREPIRVDFTVTLISLINDLLQGVNKAVIATRFHNTILSIIYRIVLKLRDLENINKVVFSGGTFQNRYLLRKSVHYLRKEGFEILLNYHVPSNDAGISLGQAYIVRERMKKGLL